MQPIHSDKAPKALGPYSQAQRVGNLIFCSGQTGFNPETGTADANDVAGQTKQALAFLGLVLEAEGLSLQNVVKCNVYITDMQFFQKMNQAYAEMFAGHKPARTTVAVAGLPLDALVEIECVAEVP